MFTVMEAGCLGYSLYQQLTAKVAANYSRAAFLTRFTAFLSARRCFPSSEAMLSQPRNNQDVIHALNICSRQKFANQCLRVCCSVFLFFCVP